MQAMQTATEEWIDKAEVAKRLKISERTVLTLVGKIEAKKVRSPESNQTVWKFHPGDVERYAFERDNPSKEVGVQATQQVLQAMPTRDIQAQNVAFQPQYVRAMRPWLTLDEAAEFSGLTKRWLLDAAARNLPLEQSVMLAVRDMGKHSPGGRWRFLRSDLEKP